MSNPDYLQQCLERLVADGKTSKMRALVIISHTRHWPCVRRRWSNLIKMRVKDTRDQIVKLAVDMCSTPEELRDTLFTSEELEALGPPMGKMEEIK